MGVYCTVWIVLEVPLDRHSLEFLKIKFPHDICYQTDTVSYVAIIKLNGLEDVSDQFRKNHEQIKKNYREKCEVLGNDMRIKELIHTCCSVNGSDDWNIASEISMEDVVG